MDDAEPKRERGEELNLSQVLLVEYLLRELFDLTVEAETVWVEARVIFELERPGAEEAFLEGSAEFAGKLRRSTAVIRQILMVSEAKTARALAHDFNNLLIVALGGVELFNIHGNRRIEKHGMDVVEASLLRMKKLFAGVSKEDIVDEVQTLKKLQASIKGLKTLLPRDFEVHVEAQGDFEVETCLSVTESRLMRLLFNLADNAYKAGARKLDISVQLREENVFIRMKDNGPGFRGLSPAKASQMSRERSATNGNGLGICEDFCSKAGGCLQLVDENDATGAEWLISLPLHGVDPH